MRKLIVACVACATCATSVEAKVYVGSLTGHVDRIGASGTAYVDSGSIKPGDAVRIKVSIDTSSYASRVTRVNDETTASYAVPIVYTIRFGGFARTASFSNYALIINDNRNYGFFSADSIGLALIGGFFRDSTFVFQTPTVYSTFSVNAFSFDTNTLSGVGFEQLLKFERLNPGTAELSFYNPDAKFAVTAFARLTGGGFAAAAPEPATWATMALGLGVAGAALRRRRVRVRVKPCRT